MLIKETIVINGIICTKTYSNEGFRIRKVGTDEIYDDAIDVLEFEYEETEELIEPVEGA